MFSVVLLAVLAVISDVMFVCNNSRHIPDESGGCRDDT